MAATFSKSSSHIRSISLPSTTHPLKSSVLEQLNRLRSTEATPAASSICQRLGGLKALYDSVDDWLQLPLTQQAVSSETERRCTEDLLDGSLRLLEICGTITDVLSQMKGSTQQLESSFRRLRGDNTAMENEINAYTMTRKNVKKVILKSLKKMAKQNIQNKEFQEEYSLTMMKEVENISISMFITLLSFLSKPKTRPNNWSMVSKVLSSKRVSCEGLSGATEVEKLDVAVQILKFGKADSNQVHNALKQAEALELTVMEIEEVMECVFRCLMKTRVSLLNVLNH